MDRSRKQKDDKAVKCLCRPFLKAFCPGAVNRTVRCVPSGTAPTVMIRKLINQHLLLKGEDNERRISNYYEQHSGKGKTW